MELLGIRDSLPRHLDIAQVSVFSMGLGSCIFHQAGPVPNVAVAAPELFFCVL